MESRGNKSRLPVITLIVILGVLTVFAAVFYYNGLLEKRLNAVDEGVLKLTAAVDQLTHRLEAAREEIRQKDQTIENLQQEIIARKEIRDRESAQQAEIALLISELQPRIDPVVADAISASIYKYSQKYGVPPELTVNLAMRESSFRLILESNKKARGLMQVMASAHPEKIEMLGIDHNSIFHIDNNIHLGTMILAEYYEANGSIYGALGAYVGAEMRNYINDILVGFADMKISQYRAIAAGESVPDENDDPETLDDSECGVDETEAEPSGTIEVSDEDR